MFEDRKMWKRMRSRAFQIHHSVLNISGVLPPSPQCFGCLVLILHMSCEFCIPLRFVTGIFVGVPVLWGGV